MGTITARMRKDKSVGYTAQIRIKSGGKVVHSESETFEREDVARRWMAKREKTLAEPGALAKVNQADPPLSTVISRYIEESQRDYGKTKIQVLKTISASDFAALPCSKITSVEVLAYARSLQSQPQTVGNYLSHLASIFAVARPAWGYPLNEQAMKDARVVAKKMNVTSKSKQRSRRPTLEELDRLMAYFGIQEVKRPNVLPMRAITAFALFSTRRQEEICRVAWDDLNVERSELTVRDMKHPGEKLGNDVRTTLTPPALRLILTRPRRDARIFPHDGKTVSSRFTRACQILGIVDLHFHDLRHEGVSRLFEMGWTIPQAATVSGHRTWSSLQRYSHMHEAGDKYAGWKWLALLGAD
jgi:integrase